MRSFLKWLGIALGSVWGTFVFLASNSPADVTNRVQGWASLPLMRSAPASFFEFASSPWTLAISFLALGLVGGWVIRGLPGTFRLGFHGLQPIIYDDSPELYPTNLDALPEAAIEEVKPEKHADVARLIYEARQLTSVLLASGECRRDEARRLLDSLNQAHVIWHDRAAFEAREVFLREGRAALAVRDANGNPGLYVSGDYEPEQRAKFEGILRARLRILEGSISV